MFDVRKALDYNWSRAQIREIANFSCKHSLPVTQVHNPLMLLDNRWIVYKNRNFKALIRCLEREQSHLIDDITHVWSDGSGTVLDSPAGIGVLVEEPSWCLGYDVIEISEHIGLGTNNVAELTAIGRGLVEVPDTKRQILVHSDSMYAIGSLTQNWTAKKNIELIASIRFDLSLRDKVNFQHVKGHSGIPQNERCDVLAKEGRQLGLKQN